MNTKTHFGAASLAILAALTFSIATPATADANIKDGVVQIAKIKGSLGPAEALVAPGYPPAPCRPGRYKCPLGTGGL